MISALEYIITADDIYSDLYDFIDDFEDEAEIINEAKCQLVNYGFLEDTALSKGLVQFIESNGDYYAAYNGIHLYLEVRDRIIIDYKIE